MTDLFHKNPIQEALENSAHINNLKSFVQDLENQYFIEHAVFGLNEKMQPCEMEQGYMVIEGSYDTLDQAFSHIKNLNTCIFVENRRVKKDNQHITEHSYTIGTRCNTLCESYKSEKDVLDLSTLQVYERRLGNGWQTFQEGDYKGEFLAFEEPSKYGIDGGRISKLHIKNTKTGKDVVSYDRGWDKKPGNQDIELMDIVSKILKEHN